MDGTLKSSITLDQNVPRSNGNEGVLHTPQISRPGALLSDGLMSYPGHLLVVVGAFYLSVEI